MFDFGVLDVVFLFLLERRFCLFSGWGERAISRCIEPHMGAAGSSCFFLILYPVPFQSVLGARQKETCKSNQPFL